uniref:Integrase catalytic domain-containing protein n=1 Tax=Vitis vinifera TaxID=29760 RepID=A5BUV8_VITVI|nr:hypothetical protein VITISV_044293 [Vitis vinifera]
MKVSLHHQKWNNTKWNNTEAKQENGKRLQDKPPKNHENNCYRCGMKGHWSRTYRTPKHLDDLYQASIKAKGKEIEMNFTDGDGLDLTYYDIDFFGVISKIHVLFGLKMNEDDVCLADCVTTYTIFRDKRYFLELTLIKANTRSPRVFNDASNNRTRGHPLKNQKILSPNEYSCAACLQDVSTRWSHVCLLSTRNVTFARLLAQIIRLRAHFPDYPIKTIRLDNAGEFTYQTFIDYCMSVGINIEHPVAHTHTQNGLAESFIKHLQLIARPLLMKTKLPTSAWGHAIMHAAALVRIRPTTYHEYSPSQLVLGKQPNISHLIIFGCAVYVPIAPTQRTKMGPQRRLGIYGGEKSILEERREISWKTSTMTYLDHCTNQCELEVQRIIHLQNLANQLLDAFIDTKKVTKSHIRVANTPARIDVPVGQLTNESKIRLKRGRPVGSKDVTPRKRRTQEKLDTLEEVIKMTDQFKIDKSIALEKAQIMQKAPKEAHIEQEALEDPHIERESPKEAQIPENCEILCNENNDIIRYKARLVAQGFSQRPGIDYEETYSLIMDAITFRFLISLVVSEGLDMRLMDYNRLSEYLLKEGYVNNPICLCIFIKKSETGFAIIAVYVDDLNLVGTLEELTITTNYLKKEFEMKDLGKTKFCLGLQIEYFPNEVLVHQSTYIKKVLKRFYMDKVHHLSSPMVVRSLDVKNDPFRHCKKNEELLGPEVPYLSAIGALMYLANCTRPDIVFSVNLLARYSSTSTRRHWNGIKHILHYLRGTIDMSLFYSRESKQQLLGYADAGYLSDPHKGRSQTGYVFNCNGTTIS